jgi:hypothetical protein
MTTLESALNRIALPRQEVLPLAHLSKAKRLSNIVRRGKLLTRHCDVFNDRLLYLSYGVPFYRPRNEFTENRDKWPVGFLFDIELVKNISRFYPFDTGAMARGLFGRRWRNEFDIDNCYTADRPERLVSCLYTSNENYLFGRVKRRISSRITILSWIHRFLLTDLSVKNIDQRQRTIECLSNVPFDLLQSMWWIAYPTHMAPDVRLLWKRSPKKFRSYEYTASRNSNPAYLCELIIAKAREEIQHFHKTP